MYFPRGTGSVTGSKADGGAKGGAGGGSPAAQQPKGKEPASSKGPATKDPGKGTGGATPANGAAAGSTPAAGSSEQAAHEPGVIEIVAQDPDGKPFAGAKFRVEVEAGPPIEGTLDAHGYAKVEGVGKKACVVSFPELNPE